MKLSPAWFLFLFAPLPAEYVSGSSPYLNPFVWLANFLLYGAGTLLIRELRVRWRKGWASVLILAAGYMVAEEGLMLNTLFDPTKNTDGRALGVNWVWTAGMLVVHSLVSILAPVMLAEAVYPELAAKSWIKPRAASLLLAAFIANIVGLGHLIAPHNRPPLFYTIAEVAFIAACVAFAKLIPFTPDSIRVGSNRRLFTVSIIGMFIVMIVNFAVPSLRIPTVLKTLIMLGSWAAYLLILHRRGAFNASSTALGKFAVASAIISFWVITSPLGSLMKHSPGPLLFGVFVGAFLWRQRKRLLQLTPSSAPAPAQTSS